MINEYVEFMIMDPDMEGGANYWNDPAGGPTKYGISQFAHPHVDIENLTLEGAIDIAIEQYYLKYKIYLMNSHMGCIVLDWVFNAGPTDIRAMQSAMKVTPDGIIGPDTARAFNLLYEKDALHAIAYFTAARQKHYMGKRDFKYYANGWLKRINKCSLWVVGYRYEPKVVSI